MIAPEAIELPGHSQQTGTEYSRSDSAGGINTMKQTIGILMQLAALSMLPAIVIFQLFYGFRLIVMPISLLTGICVFSFGTMLRESGG